LGRNVGGGRQRGLGELFVRAMRRYPARHDLGEGRGVRGEGVELKSSVFRV